MYNYLDFCKYELNEKTLSPIEASKHNYKYTIADLIAFFEKNRVNNLVVVNPDNPSGNYIPKSDILRLIDWCKDQGIKLSVDESFVDFADEENSTIIDKTILKNVI